MVWVEVESGIVTGTKIDCVEIWLDMVRDDENSL